MLASASELSLAPICETPHFFHDNGMRAAGPFFEHLEAENGYSQTALPRPFLTTFAAPALNLSGWDVLWPIGSGRQSGTRSRNRFLLFFSDNDNINTCKSDQVSALLPFCWYGRDKRDGCYGGVFPVGGAIKGKLGVDRLDFVLFPLWLSSSTGNSRTETILWPIFSRTAGGDADKLRIFPIWGRSETSTKTQSFILWPFFHSLTLKPQGPIAEGNAFFAFPFFGRAVATNADGDILESSTTVLWPFFSRTSKGKSYTKRNAPWPFYQTEHGPDIDKTYIWPIYGEKKRKNFQHTFWLWPLYFHTQSKAAEKQYESRWVTPFYARLRIDSPEKNSQNILQCWPFFRKVSSQKKTSLYGLALWPWWKDSIVERNYSPLWRIFSYRADASEKQFELLYGLCQSTSDKATGDWRIKLFPILEFGTTNGTSGFTLAKGLIAFQPHKNKKRQVLWFIQW